MELNIFDPQYVQKQQVASLQRMAAEQNNLRVQRYKQVSADWITANVRNRDMGLPIGELPIVPRKIVVGDDGEWREVPFDELQAPVLPVPVVVPSGSIRAVVPAPDRLDQVLAALEMMDAKLSAILARGK